MEEDAFERQLGTEALSALKQKVAGAVRDGDQLRALGYVDDFEQSNRVYYESFGRVAEDSAPYRGAAELRSRVQESMSPSAPPAAKNVLGKQLAEEGQDGRRQGSKRSN